MTNFEKIKSAMTPTQYAYMLYSVQGCKKCPITKCKKNKVEEITVVCIEKIRQWLESEADDE